MDLKSVQNLSVMQETWVWFLGQEDPLEKRMAIHSSTFAWRIPWTEEPGRLKSMRSQSHLETKHTHTHTSAYTHVNITYTSYASNPLYSFTHWRTLSAYTHVNITHTSYVSSPLYSSIHWRTLRLFPRLGHCDVLQVMTSVEVTPKCVCMCAKSLQSRQSRPTLWPYGLLPPGFKMLLSL